MNIKTEISVSFTPAEYEQVVVLCQVYRLFKDSITDNKTTVVPDGIDTIAFGRTEYIVNTILGKKEK